MFIQNLSLISFFSSIILLIIVSIYSYFLFKKENRFEEIEMKAYKDAKDILQNAHEKSEAILNKTVEKSKDILLQTEIFKQYVEKDLKKTLKVALDEYSQIIKGNSKEITLSYTNLFKDIKEHYVQETSKLIKEMETMSIKSLSDSNITLKEELLNSQQDFRKRIEEEFKIAQKEIEDYKKQEIDKMKSSLDKNILKILEELIGKIVPVEDHEKLILEALDKANKDGVFNQ